MLKTVIKIAVVLLLLRELWLLIQTPSVVDVVASFVMAGEIPGTDIVLELDQMIKLLVAIFIVAAILIFNKEFRMLTGWMIRKARRQTKPVVEGPVANTAVNAKPGAQAESEIETGVITRSGEPRMIVIGLWSRLHYDAGRALIAASPYAAQYLTELKAFSAKIGTQLLILLQRLGVLAWKATCVTYRHLRRLSIMAWIWLKPRIQRLDRRIEKELKSREQTAALLEIASDMKKVAAESLSKLKSFSPSRSTAEVPDIEDDTVS